MILALALALVPQAPAPQATHRVRVVRGANKELVAGAEIRSFASPEWVGIMLMDEHYDRLEPALEHAVSIGASDAKGEIAVPIGGTCVVVEARSKDLWGIARIDLADGADPFPESVREIELQPDFDLELRVVDALGKPLAGVPVAYRVQSSDPNLVFRDDKLVRTSDARGVAILRHVGFWMHLYDGPAAYRQLVAIAGCLQPAVEVLVDPAHPPPQPIVLRMPPTGEVELVFEELDGTPIPVQGDASLVPATADGDKAARPPFTAFGMRPSGAQVLAHPGTSSVVFEHVGLGAEWFVWAQRNELSEPVRARVLGPRKEGERVRVVVHPPKVLRLRGRVVDAAQGPRPGVEFSVQTRELPPKGGWAFVNAPDDMVLEGGLGLSLSRAHYPRILTDAHGAFVIDYDIAQRRCGDFYMVFVENEGQPDERGCRVLVEKEPAARLVELGDLRFAPAPVIASGTIKDQDGKALADVEVSVSPAASGYARFTTKSRADGSFRVLGVCLDKEAHLVFRREGYAEARSGGPTGDMNELEIVMEAGGRLRARVLVPAGLDVRNLGIHWNCTEPSGISGGSRGIGTLAEGGRIDMRDLPPGTYELEIISGGSAENVLVARRGIAIGPGKTVDLGEIELSGQERESTRQLVDPAKIDPGAK